MVLQALPQPVPVPERPAVLTLEDDELIDAHGDMLHGGRISADVRRQLGYLGTWRLAVWTAEARNATMLTSVIDAAHILVNAPDAACVRLEQHARDHFGVEPRGFQGGTWFDLHDWCKEQVRQYGILPIWLRTMRKPRAGVPQSKPAGQQQEQMTW